jgi:hypothetical protein
MTDVLYRCATTGQNVQVWFADGVPDNSVYISLRCPACARVYLVNRAGRTLMAPPALTLSVEKSPAEAGLQLRMKITPLQRAIKLQPPRYGAGRLADRGGAS